MSSRHSFLGSAIIARLLVPGLVYPFAYPWALERLLSGNLDGAAINTMQRHLSPEFIFSGKQLKAQSQDCTFAFLENL